MIVFARSDESWRVEARRTTMTGAGGARIVLSPNEGERVRFVGLGVRFMIEGAQSGGPSRSSSTRSKRAPSPRRCTHRYEDEYTYVLEGEIGVQVGDEVRVARPGDLDFKPRGVPHSFWNAGDAPARALEIISPAGFERYFAEIAPLLPPAHPGPPDELALGAVMARYGLEMDMNSVPVLVERHGLVA
jgi:mannose-6-phosphate isomerase-like protein (cupin superfamily)